MQTVASRVLYSGSCSAFYLSLLAASLTEIIWMLHPWIGHCCHLSYPKSRVFFAVEAYLSIGLFGETTLRLIWQQRRFWSDKGNIFDAAVSVLSMCDTNMLPSVTANTSHSRMIHPLVDLFCTVCRLCCTSTIFPRTLNWRCYL